MLLWNCVLWKLIIAFRSLIYFCLSCLFFILLLLLLLQIHLNTNLCVCVWWPWKRHSAMANKEKEELEIDVIFYMYHIRSQRIESHARYIIHYARECWILFLNRFLPISIEYVLVCILFIVCTRGIQKNSLWGLGIVVVTKTSSNTLFTIKLRSSIPTKLRYFLLAEFSWKSISFAIVSCQWYTIWIEFEFEFECTEK